MFSVRFSGLNSVSFHPIDLGFQAADYLPHPLRSVPRRVLRRAFMFSVRFSGLNSVSFHPIDLVFQAADYPPHPLRSTEPVSRPTPSPAPSLYVLSTLLRP
jgi:hypothetical protein